MSADASLDGRAPAASPSSGSAQPAAPDGQLARYERIAELAEQGLALAAAGELDRLAALQSERDALVAGLPPAAPPAARAALERAAAAERALAPLLAVARDQVAAELGHLARGRAVARGYAPPPTAPPSPTLDRPA